MKQPLPNSSFGSGTFCKASIFVRPKTTKLPRNMSLCRKDQFEMIDKGLYKQMIYITTNAIEKISHWVMLETGCDVIPRNTPFAMNPEALEKKRYQDRLAALERQIGSNGAGRSNQSNNQNGGGNNGAPRPPSNATSDVAVKKMRSNTNVASVTLSDASKKGSFVENPEKGPVTAAALFTGYDVALAEMHCFHFHMVGKECTRHNCAHRHTPLTKMDPAERDKILGHIMKTKCVFINPSLKGNKTLMALLSNEQRDGIFPPVAGASN